VTTPTPNPLLEEATKKTGLIWVSVDGTDEGPRPAWHVWHEGSAYVLAGGLEQEVPGLAETNWATVTVRSKDKGNRLVVWEAEVHQVEPESEEWSAVLPLLQAHRLNLPDGEDAPARWARECTLSRLVPTGRLLETPAEPTTGSHAAPPPRTPAATRVPVPFTLHRRSRRRRRG
jgi:hypothetical protein